MGDFNGNDKPTRAEDEYFRQRDAEILAHAQADLRAQEERRALSVRLGVGDRDLVHALYGCGLRDETAWLIEWVPALEVAWAGGVDEPERRRVRELIGDVAMQEAAAALLDRWLAEPPHRVFQVARRVLRLRLAAMEEGERERLRDRVLTACAAAARASGGLLGVGALSAEERARIDSIRTELDVA